MDTVTKKAYAKINTILDIKGRYPNGYHILDMIMLSIDLCDSLTLTKTDGCDISLFSDKKALPADSSNLALKAVNIIRKEYNIKTGVRIDLKKTIPMSAGLAGGSADCAAALTAMTELFGLSISHEKLFSMGKALGADVPFCLYKAPARAEGIGEILSPVPDMPPCCILLAKPRVSMPTPEAFKKFDAVKDAEHPDINSMIKNMEKGDLKAICQSMGNVLEPVTIKKHPVVGALKNEMTAMGALGALMSGSGTSVFGIFENRETAEKAYAAINGSYDTEGLFLTRPLSRSSFV